MTKESFTSELKAYNQQLNLLQRDIIRLEGIIIYIQNKLKQIEDYEKQNLTKE